MKTPAKQGFILLKILFFSFLVLTSLPTTAFPQENYTFERMWPTLQQPWYFYDPEGIAIDSNGNVYVADTGNCRIQKFTLDGQLIVKWGTWGEENGQFDEPYGIAVDNHGNVYVADTFNDRIQKFNSDGQFIATWGSGGAGEGQFDFPQGIAIDHLGYVYVLERGNHRIQKFTADGVFISKWGSNGSGNDQFESPEGIAIDNLGNVYVADTDNHRIQKFTSEGVFINKWGSEGDLDGQLSWPKGIAIDASGNVYVSEWGNERIQKFTANGQFLAKWGTYGSGYGDFSGPGGMAISGSNILYVADTDNQRIQKYTTSGIFIAKWATTGTALGEFHHPTGVAIDSNKNLYVADNFNNRIQKLNSEGQFIAAWGTYGSGNGQLKFPDEIEIDPLGYVYVVEGGNDRIQKFTSDGVFISKWGSQGSGNGQFENPEGIAIDHLGNVYVADTDNHRIQKFTSDGVFISKWGNQGSGNGQFENPEGIAIDHLGNVYVADKDNHRIQKFTSEGVFLAKWGSRGSEDGQFYYPYGVTIDDSGTVYVADSLNDRIQKFSSEGVFITKWGTTGNDPGRMNWPYALAVHSDGDIFLSDYYNHRIQVYKRVSVEPNNKAIIVAGGGPYQGNNLWNATQISANFAYRTLSYQGFTKDTIYYLTSDTNLDLDNNGEPDDVDADATNNNLQQAINSWASDANSLILYLIDHGGNGTFRMSGTETLSAHDLDSWLDTLQTTIQGKVTVIYDACESGTFLSILTPPSGKERIVITSTSPGESAYFITLGSISFSNYFWTHIFNGVNIKDAFDLTKEAIGYTTPYQNPLLDANGNGKGNEVEDSTLTQNVYIGNGTPIYGDVPLIESVSPDQTINGVRSALLYAENVTDDDGIARVWAVIRSPGYNQGSSDNPVQNLPSIDLMPMGGNWYEVTYENFNQEGTYQIAIYARDRVGNTSIPKLTTVSVENPLRQRAIMIVGGSQTGPLWTAMEKSATLVYEALTFQGYTDDDIYFMSPVTFSIGVDGTPTLSNLEYAINTWAKTSTQDLVLYLIGNGNSGSFQMNAAEALYASVLDGWLDILQKNIPGKVTVIYDACQSGSFLSFLEPPVNKERIVLTSAGRNQPACFLSNGDISFSKYFWTRVLNGANVRDAFLHAKQAVEFTTAPLQHGAVVAQLDDNGNGLGNEKSDGQIARYYTIGASVILAGDDPLIGTISYQQIVSRGESATIWVDNVTTTGSIEKVWAVITPPGLTNDSASDPLIDLPTAELNHTTGNRYETRYNGFTNKGTFRVTVYAMDTDGAISFPKETIVCVEACSDDYEEDDSFDTAVVIVINAEGPQLHNFHDDGDPDWVKFYAVAGETYTVEVSNAGSNCDAVIELYSTNGTNRITEKDDVGPGETEELSWACQQDGIYFVRVRQYNANVHGENTGYDLKVYRPIGPLAGFIRGTVLDGQRQEALANARIKSSEKQTAISLTDGNYLMVHPPGTVPITAQMDGYISATHTVTVSEGGSVTQNFILTPVDADSDGVNDSIDNCPDISNADQSNNDNDRMGDVCDPDDDNDGMPDEWETTYGLNPLVDDAREDKDGDGFSNIREYRKDTDPNDPQDFPEGGAMPWIPLLLLDD